MKAYLKARIEEFDTNSKIQNIRDLCRAINDFKKSYQPRTNIVKNVSRFCLLTPKVFWLGRETISLSY